MLLYHHTKTGELYRYLATAAEKTQGREGKLYTLYCPLDDGNLIYCREQAEFEADFELVTNPA